MHLIAFQVRKWTYYINPAHVHYLEPSSTDGKTYIYFNFGYGAQTLLVDEPIELVKRKLESGQ